MFKPLALFVGLRYIRSKRDNHSISFISLASMIGITLGVLVLITIVSVMNGFQSELRGRILGMVAHVTVSGIGGAKGEVSDWQALQETLSHQQGIIGAAPYIEKQVMINSEYGTPQGVLLQGIAPEFQDNVSDVNAPKHMEQGNFSALAPRHYGIALGVGLAERLNVTLGDKVTVISPQAKVTPAGLIPRMKRFTVVALYRLRLQDYDSSTAFIHLEDAGRLFKMKGKASGVRVKLDDLFQSDAMAMQLQQTLGDTFKVKSWTEDNASLFHAFRMEKIMMFIVLGLIILVALFNLVASLVMMVKDKQADIAILRTQGMSAKQVARVFIIQGSIIGVVGTLLGVFLGVLLASNVESIVPAIEHLIGQKFFAEDVFYITEVPSEVHIDEVILIAVLSLIAALLATIYPAYRAASIQPADSLRYE
ncbi:MAG TPA: lipoprotein-releasing ABC transporter permease subunit [Thiothrix sp.]|nr:lipoprotein-releasing ABC transporter permease subunit [Thiothrix sp.]